MRINSRDDKREIIFWVLVLSLMVIRAYFFGLDYFRYLDDNNTYGIFYRRNDDIWNNIIMWYKLYTFRPFAFFADAYITQWFWPIMPIVLLFYTIMHFFTVFLFYKILRISQINFTFFGISLLCFSPILLEAVYWIGASTRLVPGIFFSLLSVYVFLKSLAVKRPRFIYLIVFFMLNFLSTGFYEQIIIFNFTFTLIIIFLNWGRITKYKMQIVLVPFVSTGLMLLYYYIFRNSGRVSQRGTVISGDYINHFKDSFSKIGEIYGERSVELVKSGITQLPIEQFGIVQIIISILILIIIFSIFKRFGSLNYITDERNILFNFFIGVILLFSSFAPFFILENNYMAFRTIYPSFFGFTLILDGIFYFLYSNIGKVGKVILGFFAATVILLSIVISITEINNYKIVEESDKAIADNFISAFERSGKSDEIQVILFNTKYVYSPVSRKGIENITSSDWAFLGKLNSDYYDYYFRKFLPVQNGHNFNVSYISEDTAFFCINENFEIEELYLENSILYKMDKTPYGELEKPQEDVFNFILY